MPAEWAEQSGVQLTWPHENSDWHHHLSLVENCFVKIAYEICARENLLIVCQPANDQKAHILGLLKESKANLDNIVFAEAESNDVWARDHAALTICESWPDDVSRVNNSLFLAPPYKGAGGYSDDSNNQIKPILLKFGFNGWGNKYKSAFDNQIHHELCKQGLFRGAETEDVSHVILEGGSIESNGAGIIMTTSECLLSKERNPSLSKLEIEENILKGQLGAKKVLWLDHGFMAGDDTDSHIDTLARFCDPQTIAYMSQEDETDEHYLELKKMEEQLKGFTDLHNQPFKLIPLPMPKPIFDESGERLPATYANFLIINGAVLMPIYNDEKDKVALERIRACFPDREVVGIDCNALILQHGSLHCVTMQYPKEIRF